MQYSNKNIMSNATVHITYNRILDYIYFNLFFLFLDNKLHYIICAFFTLVAFNKFRKHNFASQLFGLTNKET